MPTLTKRGTLIQSALAQYWDHVESLGSHEIESIVRSFSHCCVNPEFRVKLLPCWNSSRPITRRFFIDGEPAAPDMALSDFIGYASNAVTATVCWGCDLGCDSFQLMGRPGLLNSLFVDEGDAIARVQSRSNTNWFFLSGHRGEIFHFHGQEEKDRNTRRNT